MLETGSDWMQRAEDWPDIEQTSEQFEALFGVVSGLVFAVALQLTSRAIFGAL